MSVGSIGTLLKLARYLYARASNVTLLVSLFYSVFLAAALMYESVLKEKSGSRRGRRGVDWVARPFPPLGQLT